MQKALLQVLKRNDPEMEIDALVSPTFKGLVDRMPEIRRVLLVDLRVLKLFSRKWREACSEVRQEGYEQAIITYRSATAATFVRFSSIEIRTGFKPVRPFLLNDQRGPHPRPRRGVLRAQAVRPSLLNDQRESRTVLHERLSRLCARPSDPFPDEVPHPVLRTDAREIAGAVERFRLDSSDKPLVAVAPGTSEGTSKKWPIEHFADLCRMLMVDYQVCILGGEVESPLGQVLATEVPGVRDLCGQSTIDDVIDLIAAVRCVIANDSGLLHVAAAVGTPLVGIYGPTSPEDFPPLTHDRAICWNRVDCSPCYVRECPYGHHECMMGIAPQEVFDKVVGLIGASSP